MSNPLLLVPGEAIAVATRMPDGSGSTHASGAPAIAAWVAARLGVPTAFAGGVGTDAAGDVIAAALAGAGVDISVLMASPDLPTATASVRYFDDGSREFEFAVRDTAATALHPDDLGDLPERCTWVHVSGSALMFGDPLAASARTAVERARATGATVSVDPNLRAELSDPDDLAVLRDVCRTADVVFPSDDELARLDLDEGDLVESGVVVCTSLGAHGARLRTKTDETTVAAMTPPHLVVDPDGAGDTFAATVVAARMRGLSWPDAVRAANRLASRAVTVSGPMTVALGPEDIAGTAQP